MYGNEKAIEGRTLFLLLFFPLAARSRDVEHAMDCNETAIESRTPFSSPVLFPLAARSRHLKQTVCDMKKANEPNPFSPFLRLPLSPQGRVYIGIALTALAIVIFLVAKYHGKSG